MGDVREREPCPHRILDDTGSAFALGCLGGGVFHAFKGARNSPRNERMVGALVAVQGNARRLGGSFAMWGGFFSLFDCSFAAIRGREDPYNSIASGFCTGAILAMRGGARSALTSGMFGGVILAVIEGLNVAITKYMSAMPLPEPPPAEAMPDAADQPWYIRMIAPAAPQQKDVDFSDPKEMAAAPGFGDAKDDYSKSERKWASPIEERKFASPIEAMRGWEPVWMLVRAHKFAPPPAAAASAPTR